MNLLWLKNTLSPDEWHATSSADFVIDSMLNVPARRTLLAVLSRVNDNGSHRPKQLPAGGGRLRSKDAAAPTYQGGFFLT